MTDLQPFLTFVLGDQRYAIAIPDVIEVAAMVALEKLADTPPAILGLANRHGGILPILDMRQIVGLEQIQVDVTTLFIVVQHHDDLAGLVVDQVEAVIYVDVATFKMTTNGRFTQAVVSYDGKLYQIIDTQPLLAEYLINVNQS